MKRPSIATFVLTLISSLFLFSLVMAEPNQTQEISQGKSPPSTTDQPIRIPLGMDTSVTGRTWPEVVGLTAEAAMARIKQDMPDAFFQVVMPDYFVTMDFNKGRVRLYVDSSLKVQKPPRVG